MARSRRTASSTARREWTNLQLDEVALPIVLAWQLERFDSATYTEHVKPAADFVAETGPKTPQERWENQEGWSPGTIAAEIAGLVAAADIARRNGDDDSAQAWELVADDWQSKVDSWTATENGPYSPRPYYLRLTKDGKAQRGHDVFDRRRRPFRHRPARGRRPELPGARATRRQALRPPGRGQHGAGGRRAARCRHPQRQVLAPLQLRRLRRDGYRRAVGHHRARHVHHVRPHLADLRR